MSDVAPRSFRAHVKHRRRFVCWTVAVCFALSAVQGARATEADESSVKAAFLYKFPAYVEWPDQSPDDDEPVEIGVVGNDAVHAALEAFASERSPEERAIRVHRVRDPAQVEGLHVLFIGSETGARRAQYIAAAHTASALTVTEQGSGEQSSIIDLLIENGRVRFTVSLAAAQEASLKISSRLLAVATDVRKGASE